MGIVILIYLGTVLSSTLGVRAISGSFGKVKFFYKKYFPPEIANNSVVSRSLLSCADQCLQQQCANMIYDRVSRGCYINGGYLLFPNGTVFQARAPELNRFVDFQQGSWGIGVQSVTPPDVSCAADADCLSHFSANSVCTAGSCECSSPCYTYIYPACTAAQCSQYGKDFTAYPTYVLKNNMDASLKPLSLDQCKETCLLATAFVCRSVDYNSKDGTCELSSDDKCSLPGSFADGGKNWSHYKRNCL